MVRRTARRRGAILRRIARIEVCALPGDACGHGPDDPSAGVGHSFADPQVAHVARTGDGRSCGRRAVVRRRSQPEKRTVGPRRTEQGARGVRSRDGCLRPNPPRRPRLRTRIAPPTAPGFFGGTQAAAAREGQTSARQRDERVGAEKLRAPVNEKKVESAKSVPAPIEAEKRAETNPSAAPVAWPRAATGTSSASAPGAGPYSRRAREPCWRCERAVSQPVSERSGAKSPGAKQSSAEQSSPEQSGAASEPGSEPAAAATAGTRGARRGRRLARISRGREERRRCAGRVR